MAGHPDWQTEQKTQKIAEMHEVFVSTQSGSWSWIYFKLNLANYIKGEMRN